MGNHFVQIHNAVSLAVCCRGVVRLPESIHDEWPHLARQLDVSAVLAPAVEVASAAACNSSAFEAEDAWSLYAYASHLPQRTRDALHSCTYDEHALMLSVTLDEAPNCAAACARLHPERLVVHIRSGDIFKPGEANGDYYQYPVAFYAAVLALRRWREVVFLTDACTAAETCNPVFSWFKNASNTAGRWPHTRFRFRHGHDLAGDMRLMRCAQQYVPARSSLSWYAIATSHVLESYYMPRGEECIAYGGKCGVPRAAAKRVDVPLPGWQLHRSWEGTPAQRAELTAYVSAQGSARA